MSNLTDGETVLNKSQKLNTCDTGAIRARLAAATPGPWHTGHATIVSGDGEDCLVVDGSNMENAVCLVTDEYSCQQANAMFIAHAPADITTLLAEVERLQFQLKAATFPTCECDTLRAEMDNWHNQAMAYSAANDELAAENARLRDEVATASKNYGKDVADLGFEKRRAETERDEARAEVATLLADLLATRDNRDNIKQRLYDTQEELDTIENARQAAWGVARAAQAERDALKAEFAELCARFNEAQDYRRNYGKGDATETAGRIVAMFMQNRGKTGIGVMVQFAACEIQGHTDALKAQLARAVAALESITTIGNGRGMGGSLPFGVAKLKEIASDALASIRTTEGGYDGK